MNEPTSSQPAPKRDALLVAGKIISVTLQVIIGIVAVVLLIALPIILFNPDDVAKALAEANSTASLPTMLTAIGLTLALALVVVVLAFHFFQLLGRIIDTVATGEVFSTLNADRMTRMGWIAVAFQVASIPITMLAEFISTHLPEEQVGADFEFSLTGVLLALVLFILARVFRQGAAMRDDLEGTV
jgi:ABC-type sulfate transport system permease component